jgi:hypothetical protein
MMLDCSLRSATEAKQENLIASLPVCRKVAISFSYCF